MSDPLILALFTHHRRMVPKALEDRLLPMCLKTGEKIVIKRDVFKPKPKERIIYLPDLSHLPPPTPKYGRIEYTTSRGIIDDVLNRHNLELIDILGKSRTTNIAQARHEAFYLMAKNTNLSLVRIAKLMKCDHTSVIHGIFRHCARYNLPAPRKSTSIKWKDL